MTGPGFEAVLLIGGGRGAGADGLPGGEGREPPGKREEEGGGGLPGHEGR